MKKYLLLLLMTCGLTLMQCDTCDCSNSGAYGTLKVRFTTNEDYPEVLITVFEGKIENQDTVESAYFKESPAKFELEAGYFYSATAHYVNGNKEIIAVDGKNMDVSSDDDCDCTTVPNVRLDLRLVD